MVIDSIAIQRRLFKASSEISDTSICTLHPFLSHIVKADRRDCDLKLRRDEYPAVVSNITTFPTAGLQTYRVPHGYSLMIVKYSSGFSVPRQVVETDHSWRAMLVADPPCEVYFRVYYTERGLSFYNEDYTTTGTLGELVESIEERLEWTRVDCVIDNDGEAMQSNEG